jgi:hypothetical protein
MFRDAERTARWLLFLACWPYFVFLIHTPLVLLASLFVARSEFRKWFFLIICTLHVVVVQTLGVEPSPRHNHAAAILLALGLGVFAERFMRWSPKGK